MKGELRTLCTDLAPSLETPPYMDGAALLRALAQVESSGGAQAIPRFERAYSIGGYYYRRSKAVRELWAKWGDWAACSYSPWQILFVVATELGYDGSPAHLREPSVAGKYVVRYLNRRIFNRGARSVAQVADGYNSGSFADQMVPEAYIVKLEAAYREETERAEDQ